MPNTKQQTKHPMDSVVSTYIAKKIPKLYDFVTCKVVKVSKNEVILEIPGLTTGVVRGWEIYDESGQIDISKLKEGDEVQAVVIDVENEKGMIELSFRLVGHQRAWDNLRKLKETQEVVEVKAIEANKGGMIIEMGRILGFLPVSQLNPEHYPRVSEGNKNKILEKLKQYVGETFRVVVIDVDEKEQKLIVSEKAANLDKHNKYLSYYKVGEEIEVTVTGVVDFGLFVELPLKDEFKDKEDAPKKIEGLVHISEVSWQRVDDIKKMYKVGDKVKAKIMTIQDGRVTLSIKRLKEDPWKNVDKYYKVGQQVKGKVIQISTYGAFVELDHDIHGLVHVSKLGSEEEKASLEVGKEYDFKIINIEPSERRLGLAKI